jgi:hypothetical protein
MVEGDRRHSGAKKKAIEEKIWENFMLLSENSQLLSRRKRHVMDCHSQRMVGGKTAKQ